MNPGKLAGHGVGDVLSAIFRGQHVPGIRLDLEMRTDRVAAQEVNQRDQMVLRRVEASHRIQKDWHVEVDPPFTRLATPRRRLRTGHRRQGVRQIGVVGQPARRSLDDLVQVGGLGERSKLVDRSTVPDAKRQSQRRADLHLEDSDPGVSNSTAMWQAS